MTIPNRTVPPAHGGQISDQILEQAITAGEHALAGVMTDDEGALLLLTAAPIMKECLQWRRRAGVIRDLCATDNVVQLMAGGR